MRSRTAAVRVAASPIEGLGVFAVRPIRPRQTVLRLDTSRVVSEEAPLRPDTGERDDHVAYLAGGRTVLLPEPERHLNHRCDPNAFLRTTAGVTRLVARRPIAAGEEVTIDYLINTHGGSSWTCRCGAPRCRGRLETSFFELPPDLQLEYLPLLEEWFAEEHREKVEALRERVRESRPADAS